MQLRDYQREGGGRTGTDDHAVGAAGEHLVCFDLWAMGHRAYQVDRRLAYDVVLDTNSRLYRVQVKSTRRPACFVRNTPRSETGYRFHARSSRRRHDKVYDHSTVDIFAFAAIDIRRVAYMLPNSQYSWVFRTDRSSFQTAMTFDECSLESVLKQLEAAK